ncbi:MAG: cytochrome b [Phreatobacter sp.]
MQIKNSTDRYGAIAQSLHWLTVILLMLAWTLGTFGDVFPRGPARATGQFVHMIAGLAILAVLAARLSWRMVDPPPPPAPTRLGLWAERAAQLTHCALYLLLIAVPIVGIVLQFARGRPVPLFGLAEIPSPWVADRAFSRNVRQVHELIAHALLILAGLHAAAALCHHWIFRDRTLARMLPGSRPTRQPSQG